MKLLVEVDQVRLFDTLKQMKMDTSCIGARLVDACLSGNPKFSDAIGLEVYGISVSKFDDDSEERTDV